MDDRGEVYLIQFVYSDGEPGTRIVHCSEAQAEKYRAMVAVLYDAEATVVEFDCSGDDAASIVEEFNRVLGEVGNG